MRADNDRPWPSSSTSALSATNRGGLLVQDIEELDDGTLQRLLFLMERARRLKGRVVAIGVIASCPPLWLLAFWPPLFIPFIALGGLMTFATGRFLRHRVESEARALGIDPRVVRTLEREAREVSNRIPRWVRGEARVEAVQLQVRALLDRRREGRDHSADDVNRPLRSQTG